LPLKAAGSRPWGATTVAQLSRTTRHQTPLRWSVPTTAGQAWRSHRPGRGQGRVAPITPGRVRNRGRQTVSDPRSAR
jgi:hypothetical protein